MNPITAALRSALFTALFAAAACVTSDPPAAPCRDNANCPADAPTCTAHGTGARGKCVAAAPAAQATAASGQGQSGTVGLSLAQALVVLVADSNGNPVTGVTVTWAVGSGGGAITAAGSSGMTNSTGADGTAAATAVLGAVVGPNTFTATAAGVSGGPVSFSATPSPGPAASFNVVFPLTVVPGVPASATVSAFDVLHNSTGYTGAVNVTLGTADANAVLPKSFALTVPANGNAKVTGITLAKVMDGQVVKVTDAAAASLTGSQAGISVGPAVALTGVTAVAPLGALHPTASGGSGTGYAWSLSANPSGGSINATSGAYAAGAKGNTSDIIKVSDSVGNSATASVSVGGGVALAGLTATSPKGSLTLTASGGSGTGFTWTLPLNNSGGGVVPSGASGAVYTAGGTGSVTDRVKVADSLGNAATLDVAVGPPVTITGSPTAPPKGSVLFAASGGSGVGFSWSLTASPSGGSIDASSGAYLAGPIGSVTDVVAVADSLGNASAANVAVGSAVSVAGASAAPPRGQLPFTASGGAGTGYVWSLSASPSGGNIVAATGAYTAGATGSVTDRVKVVDQLGNAGSASVAVGAVLGVVGGSTRPPKGSITFTAAGGSGAGLSWSLLSSPSGGAIVAGTGFYTAGATGSVTDVIKVLDSLGNSAQASVAVGPGVTISGSSSVAPRGAFSFSASGGSGAGYAWSLATNASGGSVGASTGAYTAGSTPNVTDVIKVTDSLGNFATLSISVSSGIAISGASSTPPRGTITFTASQGSGSGYTWSLATNASGGSIVAATGVYTAGPTASVTDVVQVTDSGAGVATASVTVTAGVSIAPFSAAFPKQSHAFTATGGSGAGYAWSLTAVPSGGSINAGTGLYFAGPTGSVTDTAKVTDSLGNSASVSITVTAAVSISGGTSTPPRGSIAFSCSGGSGAGFVWTLQASGSGAPSISGTLASATYTAGGTGSTADIVKVTDGLGNSATVSVAVGPGVTLTGTFTTYPQGALNLGASGGSGTYTWAVTTNASGATINSSTGQYKAGVNGSKTDVVQVTDSLNNTASANIAVTAGPTIGNAGATIPRDSRTLTASGGSGAGFAWSMQSNPSGGTVSAGGVYTAGAVPSVTDVVKLTDSVNNTGTASMVVGPAVAVSGNAPVGPRQAEVLTAANGKAPYTWAFATVGSLSGGTIAVAGSSTATYTAGSNGSVTDNVQVTDALGNTMTVAISVGPGVTLTGATSPTAPGQSRTLAVSGGSGSGYTVQLTTNASGATLTTTPPIVYTAGGTTGATDVLQATDSLGNVGTASILVQPGPATKFSVSGFPNPANPGTTGPVVVAAQDAFGNTASSFLGVVTFTAPGDSSGQSSVPAPYQFTAADSGVHTFTNAVKLVTVSNTQSIVATAGTITGAQTGIQILAIPAFAAAMTSLPDVMVGGNNTLGLFQIALPALSAGAAASIALTVSSPVLPSTQVKKRSGALLIVLAPSDLGTTVSVDPPQSTNSATPPTVYAFSLTATNAAGGVSAPTSAKLQLLRPNATMTANVQRYGATSTLLPNGKVLVAGGGRRGVNGFCSGAANILNTGELWDPATGTFTSVPTTMSTARCRHVAVLAGSLVYLFGGGASSSNAVDVYDYTSNSFSVAPVFLATARISPSVTLLPDNSMAVAGGYSSTTGGAVSSVEHYVPGVSSSIYNGVGLGEIASGLADHVAILLQGRYLLFSGGISGTGAVSNSVYTVDLNNPNATTVNTPGQGPWPAIPPVTPRMGHQAFLNATGSALILVGGISSIGGSGTFVPTVQTLNLSSSFAQVQGAQNPVTMTNARAFFPVLRTRTSDVYVAFGGTNSFNANADLGTSSIEQIDARNPSAVLVGAWGGASSLSLQRNGAGAVNLNPFNTALWSSNFAFFIAGGDPSGGGGFPGTGEVLIDP